MSPPHRRHRFTLDLQADNLAELVGVLHFLADEIEVEGREDRRIRYDGSSSVYDAALWAVDRADEHDRDQVAADPTAACDTSG